MKDNYGYLILILNPLIYGYNDEYFHYCLQQAKSRRTSISLKQMTFRNFKVETSTSRKDVPTIS